MLALLKINAGSVGLFVQHTVFLLYPVSAWGRGVNIQCVTMTPLREMLEWRPCENAPFISFFYSHMPL